MIRDSSYWEGHIPTREEYNEIIQYCNDGNCYECPYYWDDMSHCEHFDISGLPLTYLKDAEKKIKSLEDSINDLKDCLQETKDDLQVLIREKERKITYTWASPTYSVSATADALATLSTTISDTTDSMTSISTVKEEEWLPF